MRMRAGLAKLGRANPAWVPKLVALLGGRAIVALARASLLAIAWPYFCGRERNSDRMASLSRLNTIKCRLLGRPMHACLAGS